MAKHKHKRRPAGARTKAPAPGRQATTLLRERDVLAIHQNPRELSAKIQAHRKHKPSLATSDTGVIHPTLANRFHSLPGELRAHVFSLLLVRPSKWDVKHVDGCPKLTSNIDLIAERRAVDEDYHHNRCVDCGGTPYGLRHNWTLTLPPQYIAPWRSQWAPEPRNPYMCSTCWDKRWRECPDATGQHLRCFCVRRQNLEALLVCKQWWDEAGHVLYTRNTFCFETTTLFDNFCAQLRPEWRALVTRISLRAHFDPDTKEFEDSGSFSYLWRLFRKDPIHATLTGLRLIELDAVFLTRLEFVKNIMNLGYANTEIRFVLRRPERLVDCRQGNEYVYPEFARGLLLRGGFPEEISRIASRERRPWLKAGGRRIGKSALQNEVRRFSNLVMQINGDDSAWGYSEYDCSSVSHWAGWYHSIGYHTAWLPTRCTSGRRAWEELTGRCGMIVVLDGGLEVMFGEGIEEVFV